MNMDTVFRVNSKYKEDETFLSRLSMINMFKTGDLVKFKTEYDMKNVDKYGRVRYVLISNENHQGFINKEDLDIFE